MSTNPYLNEIWQTLPRLLGLYDVDEFSPTYGLGDRFHCAWKLIDFPNATFQGACHGLARLVVNGQLPAFLSEKIILKRIKSMILAVKYLTQHHSGLCEAFPNEASFCVTALVAFDTLASIKLLKKDFLSQAEVNTYIDIIRPLITFLLKNDEYHGVISNHLATACAALYLWHDLTSSKTDERGYYFLNKILASQSKEGWFKEYEGADPGYQSLCTYYLAYLHFLRPDLNLGPALQSSLQFLWHFAHPDGSFGGNYGSRSVRIYWPGGVASLAPLMPEAKVLHQFLSQSIVNHQTITLSAIDDPNLIPLFNAYCFASEFWKEDKTDIKALPALSSGKALIDFKEAGILVAKHSDYYSITSWHKGGIHYYFNKKSHATDVNYGLVVKDDKGIVYNTQKYTKNNKIKIEGNKVYIQAAFSQLNYRLPTAHDFIVLRLCSITIMKIPFMLNLIKKMLVKLLITRKKIAPFVCYREIVLGETDGIRDEISASFSGEILNKGDKYFRSTHMASQGYWQSQDDLKVADDSTI